MNELSKRDEIAESTVSQFAIIAPQQVRMQVNAIQELMASVMKDGTHFGKVKGCGDKPSLLQPGAQKLALMFQLSPTFDISRENMPGGHREYTVTCTLSRKSDGSVQGQGVGSCSTMESKYRYRNEWSNGAKKRVENPDIADVYNTVLKMANKRALVAATLNVTAASDIFTQDIEDMPESMFGATKSHYNPQAPISQTIEVEHEQVATRDEKIHAEYVKATKDAVEAGIKREGIMSWFESRFGHAMGKINDQEKLETIAWCKERTAEANELGINSQDNVLMDDDIKF